MIDLDSSRKITHYPFPSFHHVLFLKFKMATGGESFYAVIIICLIVFFSLFACFGIRVIKKLRQKNQQEALHNNNANHDWQPLRSIATPLENADSQTLEAVASKYYMHISSPHFQMYLINNYLIYRMAIEIPS